MALGYVLTLEDVLHYYDLRGPAIHVLARAAAGKTVQITDWAETLDAKNDKNFGEATDPMALSEGIRHYLSGSLPDGLPDDIPLRYPGVHATVHRDIVLEVDAKQNQKEAFDGGRVLLELLHHYDAPYRIKFSGNSSPHIVIPESAYESLVAPEEREDVFRRLFQWLVRQCEGKVGGWLDNSFHNPDHFLRLPYSLNERTGLVSLPLTLEQFERFEPAMAEVPNVNVEESWFQTDIFVEKQAGMQRLIEEAMADVKT